MVSEGAGPHRMSADTWVWREFGKGVETLRRSRIFRDSAANAAYSVADYLASPLFMIAAAPFLVARLGLEQYGLWMLVNALTGTMGVFSMGLGDATVKYVSTHRGRNDPVGVQKVFSSTLTGSALLGGLLGALILLGAPLLARQVFRIEPQHQTAALHAIQLGALIPLLRAIESVLVNTLRAYEQYGSPARISVVVKVAIVGSAVVLAGFSRGVEAIIAATAAAIALGVLLQAFTVSRLIRGISFSFTLDRAAWKEVFGFGFYSWVQLLGAMVFNQADRLLIGSLLGTTAVAYYTICMQLAQQVHGIVGAGFNFIFPHISARHEAGESDQLKRVYRLAVGVNVALVVLLCVPLLIFGKTILTLWMGADFANRSYHLLTVLVVAFAVLAINVVPHFALLGLGKVRFVSLVNLAGGVLSLAAGASLIPFFGLIGAAVGRLLYGPIITLNYLKVTKTL
jgi:O-antigen/teichoic acid export membrane protein